MKNDSSQFLPKSQSSWATTANRRFASEYGKREKVELNLWDISDVMKDGRGRFVLLAAHQARWFVLVLPGSGWCPRREGKWDRRSVITQPARKWIFQKAKMVLDSSDIAPRANKVVSETWRSSLLTLRRLDSERLIFLRSKWAEKSLFRPVKTQPFHSLVWWHEQFDNRNSNLDRETSKGYPWAIGIQPGQTTVVASALKSEDGLHHTKTGRGVLLFLLKLSSSMVSGFDVLLFWFRSRARRGAWRQFVERPTWMRVNAKAVKITHAEQWSPLLKAKHRLKARLYLSGRRQTWTGREECRSHLSCSVLTNLIKLQFDKLTRSYVVSRALAQYQ